MRALSIASARSNHLSSETVRTHLLMMQACRADECAVSGGGEKVDAGRKVPSFTRHACCPAPVILMQARSDSSGVEPTMWKRENLFFDITRHLSVNNQISFAMMPRADRAHSHLPSFRVAVRNTCAGHEQAVGRCVEQCANHFPLDLHIFRGDEQEGETCCFEKLLQRVQVQSLLRLPELCAGSSLPLGLAYRSWRLIALLAQHHSISYPKLAFGWWPEPSCRKM